MDGGGIRESSFDGPSVSLAAFDLMGLADGQLAFLNVLAFSLAYLGYLRVGNMEGSGEGGKEEG